MEENDVVIEHPNRQKASSKAAKAAVLLLLLISVALMLIVTIGGWDVLQGAKAIQIAYILIYLIMAWFVARWNRGVLPVAAALAIILLIFAAVAVPGWVDRDSTGFEQPTIDSGVLAIVTALLIPIQILLIAFAMRAFNQAWNVEIERTSPESRSTPQPA
jgi:energy-coupling factor transporter transmembrane protein EcfT